MKSPSFFWNLDGNGIITNHLNNAFSSSSKSMETLQTVTPSVIFWCEKGLRRAKGYFGIAEVMATIEQIQEEKDVWQKTGENDFRMCAPRGYR
ncbi:MAG: hypothetical protein A2026_16190 [Deltaproteobacteria bacterium RBG_19FT_COMBO_46_12]|jgi:hypothetical protein|nr:MAG: hypothetical protein A2026_16190 [Deltaproteobacteria bacterium RBG_19FT_COMBO_46_12]